MKQYSSEEFDRAREAIRMAVRNVCWRRLMEGVRGTFEYRRAVWQRMGIPHYENDPDMMKALAATFVRVLNEAWHPFVPNFSELHFAPLDEDFLRLAEQSVDHLHEFDLHWLLDGEDDARARVASNPDCKGMYTGTAESLMYAVSTGFRMYILRGEDSLSPDPW